jgi:peptidyl-tRNA hydrolase, PTH1 family
MKLFGLHRNRKSHDEELVKIVVGLGNPGQKYEKTRHNVGFAVVDEIVQRLDAGAPRDRFRSFVWETRLGRSRVILVKPQTYMNLSGTAVQQVVNWYKADQANLIVAYDDVDLDFGTLRLRERGSAGGHNGLRSIVETLGTTDVPRLRIGIGRGSHATAAHVLSGFSTAESRELPAIIERAADGLMIWLEEGPIAAMNKLNPRQSVPPSIEFDEDATDRHSPALLGATPGPES